MTPSPQPESDVLPTYTGYLRGDRVEWCGDAPPTQSDRPIPVHITLLPADPGAPDQGHQMAAALEQLAAIGGLSTIADPLEWEREQRADRGLPGREP